MLTNTVNHDYETMQQAEKLNEAVELFNLDATIEQLKAANPWAVPESAKCRGVARASKNLKKELSLRFPGVKFSVKSKSYSGGDSIRVSYTDGPAFTEVEPIVNRYQAGSFDGMNDLYSYDNRAAAKAQDAVFGDTKYAFCSRDYSVDVIRTAVDLIDAKYGIKVNVEVYGEHASFGYSHSDRNAESAVRDIRATLRATSF